MDMKPLSPPDSHHLSAATGWLELGNWQEANEELEEITPELRSHPHALVVRYEICAKAGNWELAADVARAITIRAPELAFGWVRWSFALHELKRTKEAYERLRPLIDRFPREWMMRYNLACYACQLGNLKEAWGWLEKAFELGGSKVKLLALGDKDLEPFWTKIGQV
jgi:tetratricopeptide (TPR) repeat protein